MALVSDPTIASLAVQAGTDHRQGHAVLTGVINDMTASIETRRLVVHQVMSWSPGGMRGPDGYDVRGARLRIVTYLMGATVADLDVVRDARSLADIKHCPACGPHRAD